MREEDKRKVDCRRQCAGFYKGFGNFFFGRFGHWTISDCEVCDVSVSINFLRQNYSLDTFNTRAKLPDYSISVFTDAFVNFTYIHRVVLPNLILSSRFHKFKIRYLYYGTCCRIFTICTSK